MAKIDFPVATVEGQEFIASTGVIYTYVGTPPDGYWSAEVNTSGGGGGGNQDLQSVTDEGNTTTNGATFGGPIISGGDPNDGAAVGCKILNTGIIQAARSSGGSAVWQGHTQGVTAPTSRIGADGSATFAGKVTGTNPLSNDAAPYWGLWKGGDAVGENARLILKGTSDNSNDKAINVFNKGNLASNRVFNVGFDGSASFAGTVDVGDVQIDHRGTIFITNDDTQPAYLGGYKKQKKSAPNNVFLVNRHQPHQDIFRR